MKVVLRAVAMLCFGAFWGWLNNSVWVGIAVVLTAYIGWHIYHIAQLVKWLENGRRDDLPVGGGIWAYIYERLHRYQKRDYSKKSMLVTTLKRFKKNSQAMPDGLILVDEKGHIEWMNKASSHFLGLVKSRDIGQRIGNIVRDPEFVNFFEAGDFSRSVEINSPNPALGLRLSIQVVMSDARRVILVVRDVTRLYMLEKQRREFVSNASHELRTPLTVIRGYLEALEDSRDELPPHWQSAIKALDSQSTNMQRLVNDLLASLQMESAEPLEEKPVDMAALVESVCLEVQNIVGDKVLIESDADSSTLLLGAKDELRSIVLNLVTNAANYMPEHYAAGEGVVSVVWKRTAKKGRLTVTDNGAGIAPNHISRLTERFYRVNNQPGRFQQGTGLGLSIVDQAVRRHDGFMAIESSLDRGSQFSVEFPLSRLVKEKKKGA